MAEGGKEDYSSFRGMGRARALLQAIEDFRMREERCQEPPSPPPRIQGGRTGALGEITRTYGEKAWRGRAIALPLPPQALLPMVRTGVPRLRNVPASPLRHPTTMPWCLEPHGCFPSPPGIALQTLMPSSL